MNKSFAPPVQLTLATCLGGVSLGLLLLTGSGLLTGTESRPPSFHVKLGSSAPARDQPQNGYAQIVEAVKPSVVCILSWTMKAGATETSAEAPGLAAPPGGAAVPPEGGAALPESSPDLRPSLMGVGSGVILTPEGHILTNHHVVAEAQWIWVLLPESSERHNARVLGRDAETDLAVLKIDKPGVSAATFGNSDLMKAGDVVLAIGNPFGLSQTVTSGIVSATSRSDLDITGFENFIQTDASINPGNSGGALINTNGEVIGINTAIFSRNGANVGVGFAISGNLALKIARKLAEKGEVARGYLGVSVGGLTPELAKVFGVAPQGVLVNDVVANSPAERAGYRPGDVIVSMNGQPVKNPSEFRMSVADLEPGSKVAMDVMRSGKPQRLDVVLARFPVPPAPASSKAEPKPPVVRSAPFLDGVFIQELTPTLRLEHGIPFEIKGVIVTYVEPATVLQSGLRPGMVICEVFGQPVDTVPKAIQARSRPNPVTPPRSSEPGALLLRVWISGKGYQFAAVEAKK